MKVLGSKSWFKTIGIYNYLGMFWKQNKQYFCIGKILKVWASTVPDQTFTMLQGTIIVALSGLLSPIKDSHFYFFTLSLFWLLSLGISQCYCFTICINYDNTLIYSNKINKMLFTVRTSSWKKIKSTIRL